MQVDFYHSTIQATDIFVPKLMERCLKENLSCGVIVPSADRLAFWDSHLWAYNKSKWLPHTIIQEGATAHPLTPIVLTMSNTAITHRDTVILLENATPINSDSCSRCIIPFDDTNDITLAWARDLWQHYKETTYPRRYFKTDATGRWQQKD